MKAALLQRAGTVAVEEVPDPEPGPGDLRITVGGVGLCGSDLSVFTGRWSAPSYPWIMGHEAFGSIDAVGEGVPNERIGQTVVIEPNIACLACEQCRRGWTSACTRRQSVGMNRPGALAERLVVPSRYAWKAEGDPRDLVCVEPATVVGAALRRLGSSAPARVLVVGVGAQGLLMSVELLDRGTQVHVTDVNPDRVAFASRFGARPLRPSSGERFELVVDSVGSPASMEVAVEHSEVGATVLVLGLDSHPLGLTAQAIVRRQLVLRGSLTYDHPHDFEAGVAALIERRPGAGRIVTAEYRLDQAQDAFDRSGQTPGKSWIRVNVSSEDP